MNLAHVHIVLNHVPSLGTLLGSVLLIWSLIKNDDRVKKVSLTFLALMALAVLPTYVTGNAAQRVVRQRTDIPRGLIEEHQNSAMIALGLMTATGVFAWFGLWQFRRFSRSGRANTAAVLVLSVLSSAVILRTANLGGDISHPEIREGSAPDESVGWQKPVETFTNQHSWMWPANETLHFIGMPLLFGVALTLTLRMLGVMKSIPYSALHRLLPLGVLGFILNVISGMIFFISSPGMYVSNEGFTAKIVFIVLAGACVLYFTLFDAPWAVGADKDAPVQVKVLAVCTLVSLLGVMYFGRMLPFLRH